LIILTYGSVNLLKYKIVIFSLLLISYLISLQFPLLSDEAIYLIAIKDNINLGLQTTATYFGETMYWKPSFMFNVYAIMSMPFYEWIPEEILFRTISLLFVILSLYLLFEFFKGEFNSEEKAYWGIILLLIVPGFFVFSIKIFTDILMFLFVCGALFLTQKINQNQWNKLLLILCFIGVGLTKSMIFVLLIITICLLYFYSKTKKIPKEIIILGGIAVICLMFYTYSLNIESLNKGDFGRLTKIDLNNLVNNVSKILVYIGVLCLALFRPRKEFILLYLFIIVCFLYLSTYSGLLPWYLYVLLPVFILFIIDIRKEIVVAFIPFNIFLIIILLQIAHNGNHNLNEIIDRDFTETIYIGRLGDVLANKMYDYNGVMVTPQNSFSDKEGKIWYGWPEKMTKEMLLGLIYDYENPDLWPKYVEELTPQEKYITPIARTHKTFEGSFKQIIIEEQYFLRIEKEILNDYELIEVIDKEEEMQPLYILLIKKE
jgi:hypothetical protein